MSTVLTGRLVLPSHEDDPADVPARVPVRRPSQAAQQLALAHKWQRLLDAGEVDSQKDIADRYGLSRARVSQLMGLLSLSPELQETVLYSEAVDGVEPMTERRLRSLAVEVDWEEQGRLAAGAGLSPRAG